jgi:hypothetical protein
MQTVRLSVAHSQSASSAALAVTEPGQWIESYVSTDAWVCATPSAASSLLAVLSRGALMPRTSISLVCDVHVWLIKQCVSPGSLSLCVDCADPCSHASVCGLRS